MAVKKVGESVSSTQHRYLTCSLFTELFGIFRRNLCAMHDFGLSAGQSIMLLNQQTVVGRIGKEDS